MGSELTSAPRLASDTPAQSRSSPPLAAPHRVKKPPQTRPFFYLLIFYIFVFLEPLSAPAPPNDLTVKSRRAYTSVLSAASSSQVERTAIGASERVSE